MKLIEKAKGFIEDNKEIIIRTAHGVFGVCVTYFLYRKEISIGRRIIDGGMYDKNTELIINNSGNTYDRFRTGYWRGNDTQTPQTLGDLGTLGEYLIDSESEKDEEVIGFMLATKKK